MALHLFKIYIVRSRYNEMSQHLHYQGRGGETTGFALQRNYLKRVPNSRFCGNFVGS